MTQHQTHDIDWTIGLTEQEQERVLDMISMQIYEAGAELGLQPDPETLRFSAADEATIIAHFRDTVITARRSGD